MNSFHGFNYNVDHFDKTKALEFVLGHYVFMDAKDRPVDLQHLFITEASSVVDEIERVYNLRLKYERFAAFSRNLNRLCLVAFSAAILLAIFNGGPFRPHAGSAGFLISMITVICLVAPPLILAGRLHLAERKTLSLLTDIHDTEMAIATMLGYAAMKNTVCMVEDRLDPDRLQTRSQMTLN